MQLPYSRQFTSTLYWNLFDSLTTQALLILHHIAIRLLLGSTFHGIFGCSVSLLYLALPLCNLGLDASLAPFFVVFFRNKATFRTFSFTYLLAQWGFLVFSACTFMLISLFTSTISDFFGYSLSSALSAVLAYTFVTESIKKTCKTLLQLNFWTRITALTEVLGMGIYLVLFWVFWFFRAPYQPFTLTTTWAFLAIISTAQAIVLAYALYKLYSKLPGADVRQPNSSFPHKAILQTRFFTWANQLIAQLFSGNFLVPLCVVSMGTAQASFLKIVSSIAQWVTLVGQKVFGISGNAVFAHTQTMALPARVNAFLGISTKLHQAVSLIVLFLAINGKKLVLMQSTIYYHESLFNWTLFYLMLALSFCESFFALYERWYIIEQKIWVFFVFNSISFSGLYLAIPYFSSIFQFLSILITIRFTFFLGISLFSWYYWHMQPALKINVKLTLATVIISLIFYFLV